MKKLAAQLNALAESQPQLKGHIRAVLTHLRAKTAKSWMVTVPKKTKWEEYQKELDAVSDKTEEMRYKTRYFPKDMSVGDRCYIVHDGQVRGWMEITDLLDEPEGFTCTTTGKEWPPGKYIVRSGTFHEEDGPEIGGFRGVREYTEG